MKLVLEHPYGMLKSAPSSIVEPVKQNLRFSQRLTGLADDIVSNLIKTGGSETFNGIHLRVEPDAAKFATYIGGMCNLTFSVVACNVLLTLHVECRSMHNEEHVHTCNAAHGLQPKRAGMLPPSLLQQLDCQQ